MLDDKLSLEEVTKCINLINDRIKGTTIDNLVPKMEAIRPILSDFVLDQDILYQAILEAFIGFAKDRLETYGEEALLAQPEFSQNADSIKRLFQMLTSPEAFNKYKEGEGDILIHIGGEDEDLDEDVSVISAKIKVPGTKNGALAIVGPKRMDYDKVVSNLTYLLNEIEKHFASKADRKDKDEEDW